MTATLPAAVPAGTVTGILTLAPWPGLSAGMVTEGALQPEGSLSETAPVGRSTSFWLTTRTVTSVVRPAGRAAGGVTVTGAQTPPSQARSKDE